MNNKWKVKSGSVLLPERYHTHCSCSVCCFCNKHILRNGEKITVSVNGIKEHEFIYTGPDKFV